MLSENNYHLFLQAVGVSFKETVFHQYNAVDFLHILSMQCLLRGFSEGYCFLKILYIKFKNWRKKLQQLKSA
jgi:hypothetical protein